MQDTIPSAPSTTNENRPVVLFAASPAAAQSLRHSLEGMRHDWWCFFLLGIAMVVLGTVAIGSSYVTSIVTVVMFGVLLLAAGIGELVSAVWAGKWEGFLLHMLVGVLYTVNGLLIVYAPAQSTAALTLLIACMFIVVGIFRTAAALGTRFSGWGWDLLNGLVSILLGVMIYRGWPYTGEWVIGLFVGIELLFAGWTWVMLSLGLRQLSKLAPRTTATT
jgi:uncharacterized membrane protein HdeD (DUF308 family)